MNDLKICLVSDTVYDTNGVSRFIQDFCKEAERKDKSFNVITSTKKHVYGKNKNIINIKPLLSFSMPFYKSLDLVIPRFFKIYKQIKELRPDIIHISTPGTVGLCALISSKILKIPILGIYHTDFPLYLYKNTKSKLLKFFSLLYLRLFYKSFQFIFTRSLAYKEIVAKDLNFDISKIYNLKAGINLEAFNKKHKDSRIWGKYKVRENSFKVLYVGRISIEKNIDKLLNIWCDLKLDNVELILVGDKNYKIKKKFAKRFNIKIIEKQKTKKLAKIYASSDCFIFPSTTDTLGQVVLEAMASALPVLVTNEGGPQTFVNEACGYILDSKRKESWKSSLQELVLDKELSAKKGNNAYTIAQNYSISNSFEDFYLLNEKLYKNIR